MDLYKVPKNETRVRILLDDGRTLDAGIFTSATGPRGGPETVLDRLADPTDEFLPVACGEDRMLLNRKGIIFVQCPRDAVGSEADEADARLVPVRVSLAGGMNLVGRLVIRMPPERARVLDYLNAAPRFVPLLGEREVTLVQKHFVVSVRSASESD
jgi:hypothetical protein